MSELSASSLVGGAAGSHSARQPRGHPRRRRPGSQWQLPENRGAELPSNLPSSHSAGFLPLLASAVWRTVVDPPPPLRPPPAPGVEISASVLGRSQAVSAAFAAHAIASPSSSQPSKRRIDRHSDPQIPFSTTHFPSPSHNAPTGPLLLLQSSALRPQASRRQAHAAAPVPVRYAVTARRPGSPALRRSLVQ